MAKKIQCGRTKAEALVENILAPKSIEMVLEELKVFTDSPVFYSIATDASNKGNRKLYPIAVRYFDIKCGVKDRMIDFYEDSKESSQAIFDQLMISSESRHLNIEQCSSYSADNAPVNYGKHNSVYQKLTSRNPKIIKSNCNAHVIHNAGRNACKALSFDVETLVLKIFAEFSMSAKSVDVLKQCFDDLDMEYEDVLRHVVTRWLSLFPAIERIIKKWPGLKQYFINEGEDEVDKTIWSFVKDQENELNDDLNENLTLPECYLYFVHHFMHHMTKSIKNLEKGTVMSTHIHSVMTDLRDGLQTRMDDKYFGSKVNKSLPHLTQHQRSKFEREALSVYHRALTYLGKWYDFEKSPFQHFSVLNLEDEIVDRKLFLRAAEAVDLAVDEDALYDEILSLAKIIPKIKQSDLPVDMKWVKIFESSDGFVQLPSLVGKILSIPISNAYVEKVFSVMKNVWTDLRNRMRVELVKAELLTKLNFHMSCEEFALFLNRPEQEPLLRKAMTNEKYMWKQK